MSFLRQSPAPTAHPVAPLDNETAIGGLKQMTYPSGRVVTTNYDQAGRVRSVIGSKGGANTNYVTDAVYAPHGGLHP